MKDFMLTFWKDESGQDLAEYAILLGLITIVLIGLITAFSGAIGDLFQRATDTLEGAADAPEL
ncbi:MAG: Flp family type IVb pilin [Gemmatimonadales bacterium]|nr:MAG: Flp family type IVb pilin [Gemmatimonadales bacterium]